MTDARFKTIAVTLALVVSSACSKYKEECHALVLATKTSHNAMAEVAAAARAGKRTAFEKAKKDLEAGLAQIEAVEVTGDDLKDTVLRNKQKQFLEHAKPAVDAYSRLVDAVEKNPDIRDKYRGTPPVTAGEGVTKEMEEAVSDVTVVGEVTSKQECS